MAVLQFPDEFRAELTVYAREAHPEEACGFLIGTEDEDVGGDVRFRCAAVRVTRNLHPASDSRFILDPLAYRKAEDYCARHASKGYRVIGFWHSHPDGPSTPSEVDLEQARGLYECFPYRYLYVILSMQQEIEERDRFACWRLDPSGSHFLAVAVQY